MYGRAYFVDFSYVFMSLFLYHYFYIDHFWGKARAFKTAATFSVNPRINLFNNHYYCKAHKCR